jgi:Kef-type K+ transport system membrane component KefB
MNGGSFATLLLSLALITIAARTCGKVAERLGQPAVLGELGAGILLGNLTLAGFSGVEYLKTDATLDLLSELGVILLLFHVGLESTVAEILDVGLSSLLVATLGVAGPFFLGWGVAAWLLPGESLYTHIFLGATLTATSVGITARVLKDLGRSQSKEARIILGAAVIDDVQGLAILAVVTGVVAAANQGGALSYGGIGLVLGKAALFLVGSLILGIYVSPPLFRIMSKLEASGVLLAVGLSACFLFSWIADAVGLAPIIGAFAAGLLFEELPHHDVASRGGHTLGQLVDPLVSFLAPVFFVTMGVRADLRAFAEPGVLGLAVALTLAAIVGKQLCMFGVVGKGLDRLSIGIGMIPRGEVGLIFAGIGLTLLVNDEAVVNRSVFSAVVIMVIATTVMTPPALKWSLGRQAPGREPEA